MVDNVSGAYYFDSDVEAFIDDFSVHAQFSLLPAFLRYLTTVGLGLCSAAICDVSFPLHCVGVQRG